MSERTKRRRVRRSAEERRAVVSAWQASGLSARSYELREGLSASVLWRWKREFDSAPASGKTAPRAAISFAPVHITRTEPKAMLLDRVLAEVIVRSDVRVRVMDGADMGQVALLVRGLSC